MFINFTNHPSAQWSAEQKAAAQAYGEVIDLAFPAIDPAADEAALDSLASAYAARILHMNRTLYSVRASLPLSTGSSCGWKEQASRYLLPALSVRVRRPSLRTAAL